jgi:hypothetical protein
MVSLRAVVLALALSVGYAGEFAAPSVQMNLRHDKFGNGLKMDSLKGDFQVESAVSDDLTVGLNLDNDSDSPLKSIYGKIASKFGGGKVNADLTMSMGDNSISGDITFSEGDNEIVASVDTSSSDLVDKVSYSRSGKGWSFNPTFNLKDNNVDLEASADYSDDTNVNLKLSGGDASLEINHSLDADTDIKVESDGTDFSAMRVEVARQLDSDNTVKPRFDMASKRFTMAWVRKLDGGRTLTANVDPENSLALEFEGDNDDDWKASVTAPWGDFKDADVSFGRKFNF